MFKKTIHTIFLLLATCQLYAQLDTSLVKELEQVQNAYINADELVMKVAVYTHSNGKRTLLSSGQMAMDTSNYYSNLNGMEVIINSKLVLNINHNQKTVFIQNFTNTQKGVLKSYKESYSGSLLKSLASVDSIKKIVLSQSEIKYQVYSKSDYYLSEFIIDTKTNFINKMINYPSITDFAKVDKIEIDYVSVKQKISPQEKQLFSSENLISIGTTIQLKGKLSGYSLINK